LGQKAKLLLFCICHQLIKLKDDYTSNVYSNCDLLYHQKYF
jgi:hypothetical protein